MKRLLLFCILFWGFQTAYGQWINMAPTNDGSNTYHFEKHECGVAKVGNFVVLVGGRGSRRPVIYDPRNNHLSTGSPAPVEFHHFQAVEKDGIIYMGMGLTGWYPTETPVAGVYAYEVALDSWSIETTVPLGRQRGSAQAVIRGDWIYFFNGLIQGHQAGHVNWVDRYNLVTKVWEILPDSPRARDHSIALEQGNEIVLVGGRRSKTNNGGLHSDMVDEIDVFNLTTQNWSTMGTQLPSSRAGNMAAFLLDPQANVLLNVWGGEYGGGTYDIGETLNLSTMGWGPTDPLTATTHASQIVQASGDTLYLMAGAVNGGFNRAVTDPAYVQRFINPVVLRLPQIEEEEKRDLAKPFLYQLGHQLFVNVDAQKLSLISLEGSSFALEPKAEVELPGSLAAGVYICKLITKKGSLLTQKILIR